MSILGKILLFRGRSLSTVSMYVSLGLTWPDVLEIEEEFEIMYLLKSSIMVVSFGYYNDNTVSGKIHWFLVWTLLLVITEMPNCSSVSFSTWERWGKEKKWEIWLRILVMRYITYNISVGVCVLTYTYNAGRGNVD